MHFGQMLKGCESTLRSSVSVNRLWEKKKLAASSNHLLFIFFMKPGDEVTVKTNESFFSYFGYS